MKLMLKLAAVLACLALLAAVHPACAEAGDRDFAVEHDPESGKTLVMLGDELYEADSSGNLSRVDDAELDRQGYSKIPSGAGALYLAGPISKIIRIAARWLWNRCKTWDFVKKIKRWIFPTKITRYEKELIKSSKVKQSNGRTVAKRDNIIDRKRNCSGTSSCQEMWKNNAPFDASCERIQLHHVAQEDDGLILEITSSEHRNSDIHQSDYSEIDRNEFNSWKRRYWSDRYYELCR